MIISRFSIKNHDALSWRTMQHTALNYQSIFSLKMEYNLKTMSLVKALFSTEAQTTFYCYFYLTIVRNVPLYFSPPKSPREGCAQQGLEAEEP